MAVKVEQSSLLYRELENRIAEGDQTIAFERVDRAVGVATLRLKHHLNRYPPPDWVPVPSAAWVQQQVYLHPYRKELMLRNHLQVQTSWLAEAYEQLTGTLPVLLQR